jgi:hypothetical protein
VDLRRAAARLLVFIMMGILAFAIYGFFVRGNP